MAELVGGKAAIFESGLFEIFLDNILSTTILKCRFMAIKFCRFVAVRECL